jgi:single-stranded DNA-binding protein
VSYLKLFAIGRLGKDLSDLRYTPTGMAIGEFSVATERLIKGDKKIEWIDVAIFGKTAEACKQNIAKGHQVFPPRLRTSAAYTAAVTGAAKDSHRPAPRS